MINLLKLILQYKVTKKRNMKPKITNTVDIHSFPLLTFDDSTPLTCLWMIHVVKMFTLTINKLMIKSANLFTVLLNRTIDMMIL